MVIHRYCETREPQRGKWPHTIPWGARSRGLLCTIPLHDRSVSISGSQSLARGNPSRSSRPSTKSSSVGIYGNANCGDGGTGLMPRTRRRGGDWISGRGPVKTSKSARSDSNRFRLSSRRSIRFVGRGLCHRTVKHHFTNLLLSRTVSTSARVPAVASQRSRITRRTAPT